MDIICEKEKCTGCSACLNACPKSAISMKEGQIGFLYPEIDQAKCVDCGLCKKVCPVTNELPLRKPSKCYALTVKEDELPTVASGGAATAIGRYIMKQGGIVYGCTGKDIRHVHHIRIDKEEDLEILKGSKYVQSEIGLVLKRTKKDLIDGLKVLFVGTPCQVAGLYGYLRKDYDNLYTVDLVCHGVPSQKCLNDNIDLWQNRLSRTFSDHLSVSFREKLTETVGNTAKSRISYGWFLRNQPKETPCVSVPFKNDLYMYSFLRCLTFRNNCYSCRYACDMRVADFTISDFWGLGDDAGFPVGKGASAVLINTEKASLLFEQVKPFVNFKLRTVDEAIRGNGQLQEPSKRSPYYQKFVSLYESYGYEYAAQKALFGHRLMDFANDKLHFGLVRRVLRKLKRILTNGK